MSNCRVESRVFFVRYYRVLWGRGFLPCFLRVKSKCQHLRSLHTTPSPTVTNSGAKKEFGERGTPMLESTASANREEAFQPQAIF